MKWDSLLCIILATVIGYGRAQTNFTEMIHANSVTSNVIGKSFWPPDENLFQALTTGTQVYSDIDITNCLDNVSISDSESSLAYYENNEDLYHSIGAHLSVDVDDISVGSIDATLASISSLNFRKTKVESTQLDYGQFVRSYKLRKSCLARLSFVPDFINVLSELPLKVNDTSLDSFADYKKFVSIHGGFILTGIKAGARIQVFATAKESRGYSEQQFSNRVCADISLQSGGTPKKLGPCVGFSDSALRASTSLSMIIRFYPRGGNRTLQAKLSTGVNPTLIEQFIQSASTNPYPVDYKLTPLWDLYNGRDSNITKRLDNIRKYFDLLPRMEPDNSSGVSTVHYIFELMTILVLIALLC